MSNEPHNIVGIDVSKGKSTIAVMRPFGEIVISPFEVKHTSSDLKVLADTLNRLDGKTRVVMEYTGKYYQPIARYLYESGLYVSVVHAKIIHDFANNSIRRIKTDKYETIKYLVDHPEASKVRASLRLHCTVRHVNRMIAGYRKEGKAFFIHGNRGRKPANTVDKAIRTDIVALYSNKYYDANFTHFTELLERLEGIKLSPSTVAGILEEAGIYSPRIKEKETAYP